MLILLICFFCSSFVCGMETPLKSEITEREQCSLINAVVNGSFEYGMNEQDLGYNDIIDHTKIYVRSISTVELLLRTYEEHVRNENYVEVKHASRRGLRLKNFLELFGVFYLGKDVRFYVMQGRLHNDAQQSIMHNRQQYLDAFHSSKINRIYQIRRAAQRNFYPNISEFIQSRVALLIESDKKIKKKK